jgi:hypothetical protein
MSTSGDLVRKIDAALHGRSLAMASAPDRGRMSLVRMCSRCHGPMRPAHATVEEDRITGLPVTRYRYVCDACEGHPPAGEREP